MAQQTIQIKNQVLGGISDSKYLGIADSVSKMVGFSLHNEPGVILVNPALKKISASLIDGLIKKSIVASNGETYLFSADSGKVWRIKSDKITMELCYTTSASVGESKCLGGEEYNGYIVWFTQNKVHRISLTNALVTTWATLDLNWKDFLVGDLLYHPSSIQTGVLYVGDNSVIAQLDGETWSQKAFEARLGEQKHRVSILINYLTSIIIGTFISSNVVNSMVALWNTWSTAISFKDELPEVGVNSVLKTDNLVIANIGKKGNFYVFNGSQMEQYKKIPGNWGGPFGPDTAIVHPDANVNANGMPMFALSNVSGNPADQGVYSLGSYSREYNKILNLEYVISTGHMANVEIGSIFMMGTDFFVCWKDNTVPATPIYGVDKVDLDNKFNGAFFETRLIQINRKETKDVFVDVFYRTLPANTDIKIQTRVNHGNWSSPISLVNDTVHKRKYKKIAIKAACIEIRVVTSSYGNTAPEIDLTEISFN